MSVIYGRAPLRVSLGGGGTDLPSYYQKFGGFVVAGAIDKYVYMLVHTTFQQRYRMKYSEIEEVESASEIRHPILREALINHWHGNPLEIASVADVPSGTGMGSSGAFTVCVLKSLAHAKHVSITPSSLAEAACHIEIDLLGEPVGKQDQYVAAHGGICAYTFLPDGTTEVEPLELDPHTIGELRNRLLLFFTGETRLGVCCASGPGSPLSAGDKAMLNNLHRTKEIGKESRVLLEKGDLTGYAQLMHEHWINKRSRSEGMANDRIDRLYAAARDHGALGGKLIGAGSGGFLLVYTLSAEETRDALQKEGAPELVFDFEYSGAVANENS